MKNKISILFALLVVLSMSFGLTTFAGGPPVNRLDIMLTADTTHQEGILGAQITVTVPGEAPVVLSTNVTGSAWFETTASQVSWQITSVPVGYVNPGTSGDAFGFFHIVVSPAGQPGDVNDNDNDNDNENDGAPPPPTDNRQGTNPATGEQLLQTGAPFSSNGFLFPGIVALLGVVGAFFTLKRLR